MSTLNFKAYKQEQPTFGSYSRSSEPAATTTVDKTSGFAPVQVSAQASAEANAALQLKVNAKQVWGRESAAPEDEKSKAPTTEPSASAAAGMQSTTGPSSSQKKAEAAKPAVDEKKEKMKNALFSGISAKKDSDDSDDGQKKQDVKEEPAGEVNLLDFDSGPTIQESPPGDLLDTGMPKSNAGTNDLLGVMDSGMPQAQPSGPPDLTSQFDNILSGFGPSPDS